MARQTYRPPARTTPTASKPGASPGQKIKPPLATKPAASFDRGPGLSAPSPQKLDKKTDSGNY